MSCGDVSQRRGLIVIVSALLAVEVSCLVVRDHQNVQRDYVERAVTSSIITGAKSSCVKMVNMNSHVTVGVSVGTPPQTFDLVADTGSHGVIVPSCLNRNMLSPNCFTGSDRSSTFVQPPPNSSLRRLSFGSGDIIVAIATDVLQVGQERATMKDGLLLMVDQRLNIAGNFEGILGLGLPFMKSPPKIAGADPANRKVATKPSIIDGVKPTNETGPPMPRFLDEAGVSRFSICMNDNGADGVLRMRPPPAAKMLKQVGGFHWALDFQGISLGSASSLSSGLTFCDPAFKKSGQDIACAAIPDSGTTLMLGPPEQIDELMTELCMQWPRCFKHQSDIPPAAALHNLVYHCSDWMHESEEGIGEMPSVFLHFGGADAATQVLELKPDAYIGQQKDHNGYTVCETLFGAFEMRTALHGPVWIIGTPLFYEFQVVYDMSNGGSIGFSDSSCGSCDGAMSMVLDKGFRQAKRVPRLMSGKSRMPSIDTRQPL